MEKKISIAYNGNNWSFFCKKEQKWKCFYDRENGNL